MSELQVNAANMEEVTITDIFHGNTIRAGVNIYMPIVYGLSYALNQNYNLIFPKKLFDENYVSNNSARVIKRYNKNVKRNWKNRAEATDPQSLISTCDLQNKNSKIAIANFSNLCDEYGIQVINEVKEADVLLWKDPYDSSNCLRANQKSNLISAHGIITPDLFEKYFKDIHDTYIKIKEYEELDRISDYFKEVIKKQFDPNDPNAPSVLSFICGQTYCTIYNMNCHISFFDYGLENIFDDNVRKAVCICLLSQIISKTVDDQTGERVWRLSDSLWCDSGWDQYFDKKLDYEVKIKYCGELKKLRSW